MADVRRRRVSIRVSWATLLKIVTAVGAVYVFVRLAWVLMLLLVAMIIAVGLAPAVSWLEQRRWPRWLAAWGLVALIVSVLVGFFILSWSSLSSQAHNLGDQLTLIEREIISRIPQRILETINRSGTRADTSVIAPYIASIGRNLLYAAGAFVLAWVFVAYLLIEARPTYRWVRGFVSERHRARFDATAREACNAAYGFILGNVVTSVCAGVYFFVWLTILGVPAALLLAVLAFFCDFIPVVGFLLSCLPAMAMAATKSAAIAVVVVPLLYAAYHFIETYLIGPWVYGDRLRLSNIAVLLAFAIGAEVGGVLGAVLALPLAAMYPAIERHWLREPFGEDVVAEHEAVSGTPTIASRKRTA